RPNELINIIRHLRNGKSPGFDDITNNVIKCFSKKNIIFLCKIFNACFKIGYFPNQWKTAKVKPLLKPNKNSSNPLSYRPISLLPALSKLFEKIIHSRLNKYIKNKIINEQFGFRKNHSTVHQITRITEHISMNFNKRRHVALFTLDQEKSFDVVWHNGLLFKLIKLGIPEPLIDILSSYLKNRKFSVVVNDAISNSRDILAGVPQGSVLGPILFNIYINDIPIAPHCKLALYADDTVCFTSGKNPDVTTKRLQVAFYKISHYFNKWKIKINNDKTDAIFFSVRKRRPVLNLKDNEGNSIEWKKQIKYLGVILDSRLRWAPHIAEVRKKALAAMAALYPIFNRRSHLSRQNRIILYRALITPILLYAVPTWGNASPSNIKKLQTVQNKALKIIYNTPLLTNLKKLHIEHSIPTILDNIIKFTEKFYDKIDCDHDNSEIANLGNYNLNSLPFKYVHKLPKHILLDNPSNKSSSTH
ncbi:MAG: RNA-directed DNA polymerase, partial [Brevinema sp.]